MINNISDDNKYTYMVFLVQNQHDVDEAMRLINDHNEFTMKEESKDTFGEPIEIIGLLKHKATGDYYLEALSG